MLTITVNGYPHIDCPPGASTVSWSWPSADPNYSSKMKIALADPNYKEKVIAFAEKEVNRIAHNIFVMVDETLKDMDKPYSPYP